MVSGSVPYCPSVRRRPSRDVLNSTDRPMGTTTPLGRPVVPPEYHMTMSSGERGMRGAGSQVVAICS